MRRFFFVPLVLALWLLPLSLALAGDFIDTRITFAISDDNLLAGPGETNPSSPSTSFTPGERSNLFFDNYNTKDSGFESLSHIVLYKKLPSFFKNLTTAASLVVRMDYHLEKKEFRLRDSGSYLILDYDLDSSKHTRRHIEITAFPLSSDRFRLGYSYDISWGGDSTFPRRYLKSPVPGIKLKFGYDFLQKMGMFFFLGAKTALLQQYVTGDVIEEETAYGFLGGLGFYAGGFRFEAGGAFFSKGTFFNPAVKREPVYFYGASGQISYSKGLPVGVSIDFKLYKNDPDMPAKFFKEEKYTPGKFSFAVAVEGSYVANLLEDPDTLSGIVPAPGIASDINFRMKYGYFRLHADIVFRDLGFILRDVPGFVPFQAFSKEQAVSPEFFAALGADYYIAPAHLTIGLKGGIQIPATFRGNLPSEIVGNEPPASLQGEQIVVVRDEGDFIIVPTKDREGREITILPVFSVKLNLKWQLSSFMAIIGELLFSVDQNQTRLFKDQVEGTIEPNYYRGFQNPFLFGFNIMMQARF
jgi:hypothetical protein